MNEQSAKIGWGGLKKDLAPAGSAITLLRQGLDATYTKGLGTHAHSEVIYDLQGEDFDFFESYIGIDQAVKAQASSATFEVWVDGKKKFTSDVFRANTEREFIRVPITGAKEIKLVTTDAKQNGNTADHTVWGGAKFTLESSKPTLTIPKSVATKVGVPIDLQASYEAIDPEDGDLTDNVKVSGIDKVNFDKPGKYKITYSVTDSDGNKVSKKKTISVVNMEDFVYLSDIDWKSTQNSYTAPKKDISISNNPLRLTNKDGNEIAYKKGIGAHSNSTIVYDLTNVDAAYLSAFVGVDRQMYGTIGSIVFQVYVDGEKQFDSGLMNSKDPQKLFEVDVSGAKELKIVVTDGGNGNGSDHATWGDAKLYLANIDVDTTELTERIEQAKQYEKDNYTESSYDALQEAISEAEKAVGNVETQEEVAEAVTLLQEAIDGLVKAKDPDPEINTTKLTKLIEQAKQYEKDSYTKGSYDALQEAISEAEKVVENAETQEKVSEAIKLLQKAIERLERIIEPEPDPKPDPEIDITELAKLIEHAKVYEQENYTETSFAALQEAISQSEKVVEKAKTQEEVTETITLLQKAIDGLERAPDPEPEPNPDPEIDTTELAKLIEHARVYEIDNFTETSFAALQQAISQAEKVMENPKSQAEVSEVMILLQKAIDELERVTKPEPDPEVDTSALSKLIEHAKSI
ncbi:tetratricopeptide (TPR) repeat protein [Lederbergia galactosidilyticus]|nr:tetratricopeptide (TPR) repeat protein [Lederbergia galactosidilytica]